MMPKALKANRGQALVAVLLLTLVVVLLGTQTLTAAWNGLFASQTSASAMSAQAAAEGAIDFGMAALNTTIPSGPQSRLQPLPAYFTATGPRTWRYADEANGHTLRQGLSGQVRSLTIEIPTTVPVTAGSGRPEDYRILTATASSDGRERQVRAIAIMETTEVASMQPIFKRAITSAGDLRAGGAFDTIRTDSYDSRRGPYGGGNVGNAGGVHANGSVTGGGVYRGMVTATGTIDPDVVVQGTGNQILTGMPQETLPSLPPPLEQPVTVTWQAGDALQAPAGTIWNLGAVALSGGDSLSLLPGTYRMAALQVAGGGRLIIPGGGPTTVYLSGAVDVTGNGIVTTSQQPRDLRLIVTGPGTTVKIAGNGAFYGLLHAPASQVVLGGNGVYYGAVVGGTVTFNGSNSTMHYDESAATTYSVAADERRPSQFRVVAVNLTGP